MEFPSISHAKKLWSVPSYWLFGLIAKLTRRSIARAAIMPVASMLAIIAILAVVGLANQNRTTTVESLLEKATLTARVIAPNAAAAVWQLDAQSCRRILQSLASDPDFASGLIVDDQGKPFASFENGSIGTEPLTLPIVAALLGTTHSKSWDVAKLSEFVTNNEVIDILPLVTDDKQPKSIGYMALSFSRQRANTAARKVSFAIGAAGLVTLMAVCALLAWILSHVTRPIRDMTDAMSRLSAGEHDIAIPALERRDEIGAMAHALAVLKDNSIERERLEFLTTRLQQTGDELRRNNALVEHMAHHDPLTSLANRALLRRKIEATIEQLKKNGDPFGVFIVDLDRFKAVNDSLGHAAGDTLLKQVAHRLSATVHDNDVVARLGGDEFAIIQMPQRPFEKSLDGRKDHRRRALKLATEILQSLREPFDLGGNMAVIGCSIGISLAPDDASESEDLMKKADLALYEAKAAGRNRVFLFDVEMTKLADERVCLDAEMRVGLTRGEFELFYQPVVDVWTCKVMCAEALLRWHHPIHGLMLPDRFLPIAEDTGLIDRLGEWGLRQACREAMAWPEHVKLAVNVSAVVFRNSNLVQVILSALTDSGLPPSRLEIEVTEIALNGKQADYLAALHQLQQIGVAVVLDDFGTGYSSLSYLRMFPFDKIKIDRSFTQDITERVDCAVILNSILALGRSLAMITTVKGVETDRQFELIRAAGATLAQGYLLGKPTPASGLDFKHTHIGRVVETTA